MFMFRLHNLTTDAKVFHCCFWYMNFTCVKYYYVYNYVALVVICVLPSQLLTYHRDHVRRFQQQSTVLGDQCRSRSLLEHVCCTLLNGPDLQSIHRQLVTPIGLKAQYLKNSWMCYT